MTAASICWCESKSLARSLSALLSLAADTTTTPTRTTTHLLPSAAGLESAENTPRHYIPPRATLTLVVKTRVLIIDLSLSLGS